MEVLPYFFDLLKNNHIVTTAVTIRRLTDGDLAGADYTRYNRNNVLIRNFALNEHETFTKVTILMSNFGVLIDFVTDDARYFNNTDMYFNVNVIARSKPPHHHGDALFAVKGKRIGTLNFFSGTVHTNVMQSELYGCKIMTSFYNKKANNHFNNVAISTESEFLNSIRSIK